MGFRGDPTRFGMTAWTGAKQRDGNRAEGALEGAAGVLEG